MPTRIAAIDGVDCLWVGHFDLSVSLGIPGEFDNQIFKRRHRQDVAAATKKHNKSLGRLVPTVEQGIALNKMGFDFICYSGDVWVLHNALAEAIAELRKRLQGRKGPLTMADKFRVALSGDFSKADGSPTFPDFDLAPLHRRAGRRDGIPRDRTIRSRPSSSRISTR